MLLCHGMLQRDIKFILHQLAVQSVRIIRLFRLQRRQLNAAAGKMRRPRSMDHIAAHRANIQHGAQQISRPVGVDHLFTGEQLRYGNLQRPGQWLQ